MSGPLGLVDRAAPEERRETPEGRTVVVKYGGHAMADEPLRRAFAQDVLALRSRGVRTVVVHGGGPQIGAHLDRLGLKSAFLNGLRVTTPETMDVVRMVLSGKVQKELVGLLNEDGPYAVGLSGEDARTLTAVKRFADVGGERVDIGLVGDVTRVNTAVLGLLLEHRHIPVVSSVGRGEDGQVYNVNADTAAGAVAAALGADALVVLTDVPGLYADWPDSERVVDRMTAVELEGLLPRLGGGMVPKMEACLRAVRAGVGAARVLDGRAPHALLDGLSGRRGIGTTIVPDRTP
ncbi:MULTISPECIES: acetylglutamate kinase [unclassified Streptomyces]|uniref:acetylglutamate kinase n=1 Tax=unclassified Streptomyces TaxID=2593676 RepID=UPI00225AEC75|nr:MULTISPECIES: acetylglutamate kinase [unclassified Streptomyces]MCX5136803.1 acetylglutamate kinase [Streptomyces sp. NBC_00340]MCX5285247.1 acetylglutamate kinase [Streptomyces sp. NBC_00198]WSD82469.1 acetylglutamate kinase [Streptomyces sp. NBC_01558]